LAIFLNFADVFIFQEILGKSIRLFFGTGAEYEKNCRKKFQKFSEKIKKILKIFQEFFRNSKKFQKFFRNFRSQKISRDLN